MTYGGLIFIHCSFYDLGLKDNAPWWNENWYLIVFFGGISHIIIETEYGKRCYRSDNLKHIKDLRIYLKYENDLIFNRIFLDI